MIKHTIKYTFRYKKGDAEPILPSADKAEPLL